jgi:hypothetical protein
VAVMTGLTASAVATGTKRNAPTSENNANAGRVIPEIPIFFSKTNPPDD